MITNKDVRVENGNLVLNGDKYPLDGQSPETIMQIVEDNSDTTPTENSDAPITSGGVFTALGTKQDTLTFDTEPTDASTNPVTSGGIKSYLGNLITVLECVGTIASIAGNTDATVSIPITIPSGYKILGVFSSAASNRNVAVTGSLMSASAISVYAANLYSLALTDISIYVNVAFIKE